MPTETETKGEIRVYLVIDEEEKEIKPLLVWFSYKLLKKQKRDFRICQILRFWRIQNKNYYPKKKFKRVLWNMYRGENE